jgi:hypothetical protein
MGEKVNKTVLRGTACTSAPGLNYYKLPKMGRRGPTFLISIPNANPSSYQLEVQVMLH